MSVTEKPTIAVVGPGRMGIGIAAAMALAGNPVQLVDLKSRSADASNDALRTAELKIASDLALLVSIEFLDADGADRAGEQIGYANVTAADEALSSAQVIFEAVPEVLEIKEATYRRISASASPEALIASTTSTFGVETLAAWVREPSRFMNTHWLNPPTLMPIVEIASAATSSHAVSAMTALLEAAGKIPIRCAPSAGFIVPRIQVLAMNEAARLVEEGVADAEAIDIACRLGFGVRFATMGLLEFIDWGGSDILLYASDYLVEARGSDRYASPDIVAEKVRSGALGVKAGRGFHDFDGRDPDEYQRETLRKLVDLLEHLGVLRRPVSWAGETVNQEATIP